MSQLVLPIRLPDHAVFATFFVGGNRELVEYLERLAVGSARVGCWVVGAAATGKTHLLQATCERRGADAVYLPADLLADAGPGMLEGLESRQLVALDDVDALLGADEWETALFALYNRLLESDVTLIVSSRTPQRETVIRLPDLASRLSQLPTYAIQALEDDERKEALKLRAAHRGLELPDETAQYLITRSRRDMASLYALLDKLDLEALRAQRRLTVPFVRGVLEQA